MGDRELCMAAVVQDWEALEFVSEEMKGDCELCTAAVSQQCHVAFTKLPSPPA